MIEYQPATVTTRLVWDRTRFELLDSRANILSIFEVLGLLQSFRTQQDALFIHLRDGREVAVGLNDVSIYEVVALQLPKDHEDYWSSIALAEAVGTNLNVVAVAPSISFQHVIGWDTELTAAEAYAEATTSVVDIAADIGADDFSVLLDGHEDLWTYQVEFGVIAGRDAAARLLRIVGRTDGFIPENIPEVAGLEFPEVATFVDATWNSQRYQRPIPLSDADRALAAVTPLASRLAARIHSRVSGTALDGGVSGNTDETKS